MKHERARQPLSRSLRVYQKIALLFVVFSVILLLGVLYLSVSQAVIRIVPIAETLTSTISVEVTPTPNTLNQAAGTVVQENFSKAKQFIVPEEGGTPVEANASGVVSMINETGSPIDLVVRTRLLSQDDVLFRLTEAVRVPANGQVDASVEADIAGEDGDILPARFTIPGLPADTQNLIFAVSTEAMAGGLQYLTTISQADLDEAEQSLTDEIMEESKDILRSRVDSTRLTGESYDVVVTEKSVDTPVGTETGIFTISLSIELTGVFFDEEILRQFAEEDLRKQLMEGYELVSVNMDGFNTVVQSVDTGTGKARLETYLDGTSVIAVTSQSLDLDDFIGRAPQEVVESLEAEDTISEVQISFTPFWLKRIPTLKDHIRIIIEDTK
jgi:hypothetical protein